MFHADLHIHSSYAYACARDITPEKLSFWARKKGLEVIGTGDFTHPKWRKELMEKLVPAEPGLFRLRPELEDMVEEELGAPIGQPTRFMLEVETSTIYRKGDKTRKIHHLHYMPSFDAMNRFCAVLEGRGFNLKSDGRPILGLDSRSLLEITLESDPDAYLIPAHIWTPWFAVLGSRGGFDSIDDAYEDLTPHIFALETGLSSDPEMNWRLSQLDRYRLVSSSDAHSPQKLGREATQFTCDLDYFGIRNALKNGEGYHGTVEFFPEEGKYHEDGHRDCKTRLTPEETLALDGVCPVCKKPVTVGVLHRVAKLADRTAEEVIKHKPATAGHVTSLIPLTEIIGEVLGKGVATKSTLLKYEALLQELGSEYEILQSVPLGDIARTGGDLLAEAIARLRRGQVIRFAGYDGEYGVIKLFAEGELRVQDKRAA